jgi:hypothetical protein
MSEKELDICKDAIDLWGLGENYGMLSEESGELLSAVNKFRRGRNTAQDVITELADVSLIIKAFAMYFGYDKFIEERNYKLERLEKRLIDWKIRNTDLQIKKIKTMTPITFNIPDDRVDEFKALMEKFGASEKPANDEGYVRALDTSLPITERVKTFDDACLIVHGKTAEQWLSENETDCMEAHVLAYLKLCVIAKALRNGWKPVYDGQTPRYFPWFAIWTKDEQENMTEDAKKEWILCKLPAGVGLAHDGSTLGVSVLPSDHVVSYARPLFGGALASEKSEIARYFGSAFLDIWVDYITGNEELAKPAQADE